MTREGVVAQIRDVIARAVAESLSSEQNFPSVRQLVGGSWTISISGNPDLSISLRNLSYRDIYSTLEEGRAFNLKMVDGALVQMIYAFDAQGLSAHRLNFFPSPDLEHFQNEPELYEADSVYADILNRSIVPFPVRFDYNRTPPPSHLPHPRSHLTLGQYANCRIPVSAPLSPFDFAAFIFRNFYNTAYRELSPRLQFDGECFDDCIEDAFLSVAHLRLRQVAQAQSTVS